MTGEDGMSGLTDEGGQSGMTDEDGQSNVAGERDQIGMNSRMETARGLVCVSDESGLFIFIWAFVNGHVSLSPFRIPHTYIGISQPRIMMVH